MVPFVGRRVEVDLLRECLAQARAGRPRIALVRGPAGIGKTALLEHLLAGCADEPGITVLRASGEEHEGLLAFGLLRQLQPSIGDTDPVDPVTAGIGLLAYLDRMSASVVVLAVDDVQWADRPSVQALVFALRRLVADRVLAVFVARDDGADELPTSLARLVDGPNGVVIRLPGLDEQELRDLAQAMGVGSIGSTVARRLRAGTDGNPLHARALLEEYPVSRLSVDDQDEQPLPPPRSFRRLVGDRYAACGEQARRLIDAVAVLGQRASVTGAAELAGLADPTDAVGAVDTAVRHELLRVRPAELPWAVEFTHPLVRSAVYDALGPAQRHALHTAAADQAVDEVVKLRHRVAAATGPDERLAADLTAYAERAQRRFDWKSAAAHLVSASRLSSDPVRARRRVLWSAVWTLLRGDAAAAADLTDEITSYPPDPLRDLVLGSLAIAAEDPPRAERLLARAWSACETVDSATDPEVTAVVALMRAIDCYGRLDAAGTVSWSERALEAMGPSGTGAGTESSIYPATVTYLVHGLGYAGRTGESRAAVRPVDGNPEDALRLWLNPRSAGGVLHLIDDDYDSAAAMLRSVGDTAADLGILNTAAFSLAYLARTEWMTGQWDEAQIHADRAVAINLESDFGFLRSAVVGIAVLVPAARGDWQAAEHYLRLLPPVEIRYERSIVARAMARARMAEAKGQPLQVIAALDPVRRFPEREAVDEPGFWAWPNLYSDALVATGRVEEADRLLVPHERLAAERGRITPQARLARARGRVEAAAGRPAAAQAAFDRALELIGTVNAPFERARIELAAGQGMRRAGRRRRAVQLLFAARDRFAALGAAPYAGLCDAELVAAGLAAGSRSGEPRFGLTSQELVVARLAARGLSNREIAAELVVSLKTVEYHLRNAFAKLGVTSRRQLGSRLADPPDGAG